jgi:hypothetical protein
MATKRVHILSAVNAANVSKTGGTYTVRDVCGAVDEIVMNGLLYPAEQLAAGAPTLEGKPAPAGHPRDASGRAISALNGDALLASYIGAVCKNARHAGGKTLVDVVVNEAQAKAHPDGVKLIERLDAAIDGTNSDPIHVSTGVWLDAITANGESRGKKYTAVASNIRYDHLAILLNERGAGTPEDGVGLFLNSDGSETPIEHVRVSDQPEDRRTSGLKAWVMRLIGNGTELSFDQIISALHEALPEGAWVREVFDRYAVWSDSTGKLYRQDYAVSSTGSVAFAGSAVEVTRKVTYEPITNREDLMKELITNALRAAGIAIDGKTDEQLMKDYNALTLQPVQAQLTAANSKVAEFEATARAAADAELNTLATELSVNSSLKAEDFKAMGLARCRELKGTAIAAPVITGNSGGTTKPGDEFAAYDMNAALDAKR